MACETRHTETAYLPKHAYDKLNILNHTAVVHATSDPWSHGSYANVSLHNYFFPAATNIRGHGERVFLFSLPFPSPSRDASR